MNEAVFVVALCLKHAHSIDCRLLAGSEELDLRSSRQLSVNLAIDPSSKEIRVPEQMGLTWQVATTINI